MASNKHAQIRYKVLDDCFSNFRRKFYFDDLMDRCNDALRELYGPEHTGIKTRTLRSDISYMRDRAGAEGVCAGVIRGKSVCSPGPQRGNTFLGRPGTAEGWKNQFLVHVKN